MKTTTTTLKKKVNLPFPHAGSKASMINNLLSILPASINWTKNTGIIEVFCGSSIFSFNMMHHFQNTVAILNDKDDMLIKVFLEIKNNCAKLIEELDKTNISSETLFKMHLLRQDNIAETDFNRVISYLYIKYFNTPQRYDMYNSVLRTNCAYNSPPALYNTFNSIKKIENYLQRCLINNKNFDDFLKMLKKKIENGIGYLLFIDPPYLNTSSGSTNIDYKKFNETDMQRLLDYLDAHCKIPFIFCHFPHNMIENWANKNGHTINKFSKNSNTSVLVSTQRKEKEEWFITNYNTFYTHE